MRRFLIALASALLLIAAPAYAQEKKVLKFGWAQDPQTLSAFVDTVRDESPERIDELKKLVDEARRKKK